MTVDRNDREGIDPVADAARARAAVRDGLVPIHGSAIANGGRGIVLAGVSGSGKSTLAAVAVQFGWSYLADEVAATSPSDGRIEPYHRPIGIRRAGAAALGLTVPDSPTVPSDAVPFVVPEAARASHATVAAVALVSWDRTGVPTSTLVSPAEAMVELMQHLVAETNEVPVSFGRVEELVRCVPTYRLVYVDPTTDGVEALAEILAATT